jgi:hypothetical protein
MTAWVNFGRWSITNRLSLYFALGGQASVTVYVWDIPVPGAIMLVDIAAKARIQVARFVAEVLAKHLQPEKAEELAVARSEGAGPTIMRSQSRWRSNSA